MLSFLMCGMDGICGDCVNCIEAMFFLGGNKAGLGRKLKQMDHLELVVVILMIRRGVECQVSKERHTRVFSCFSDY